jgi:FAD synthase
MVCLLLFERDPSIPAESAGGRDDGYAVALHFGPRPTDQDPSPSLELHILDAQKFDTDYNAEEIDVEIIQFIREIRTFDNFAQLRDQIQKDIGQIQKVLQ